MTITHSDSEAHAIIRAIGRLYTLELEEKDADKKEEYQEDQTALCHLYNRTTGFKNTKKPKGIRFTLKVKWDDVNDSQVLPQHLLTDEDKHDLLKRLATLLEIEAQILSVKRGYTVNTKIKMKDIH